MELPQPLEPALFLERLNRFAVRVRRPDGREVLAHLPNSGRLAELLRPGAPARIHPADRPGRRTPYDLVLIRSPEGVWVSVDTRFPARLLVAHREGIPFLRDWPELRTEVRVGRHRLDLRARGPEGTFWIEAKSVTLVEEGVGLFPDAPTERGRRHLELLARLRTEGARAAVAFVVQRPDVRAVAPHEAADPAFAAAFRAARAAGVEAYALRCRIDPEAGRIELLGEVPVWERHRSPLRSRRR